MLNETMGFYRLAKVGTKENQWIVQRALELAARMGLTTGTSEAWATTLINCATSMRAAKQYDQAEDLYHQAQSVCRHSLAPTDRRLRSTAQQSVDALQRDESARQGGTGVALKRCALSKPRA